MQGPSIGTTDEILPMEIFGTVLLVLLALFVGGILVHVFLVHLLLALRQAKSPPDDGR